MDKFTFKQLLTLIVVLFGMAIVGGLTLSSCVADRKVVVIECPGDNPCSTITVRFKNMRAVPADTLNATATRIIQELRR